MSSDQDTIEHEDEGWYIREVGQGHGRQLWHVTAQTATRRGVSNPGGGPGSYFAAEPGHTIWASIGRKTGWMDGVVHPGPFQRMILGPGQYYPRIARPYALAEAQTLGLPVLHLEQRYLTGAQNQLDSLIDALRAICRVVQPSPSTLAVYGHEIRNLLILASTEVEMHWRGILTANGHSAKGSTTQYVRLADPLRLRDYRVRFNPCPDIDPVAPFATWDVKSTSKSLPWYAAYNGVKHNREFEFEKATLGNAFDAIAACAVMLVAQFGQEAITPDLRRFLEIEVPEWQIEEMYLMPETGEGWRQQHHPALG